MSAWQEAVRALEDGLGVGPGLASVVLALVLFLSAGTLVRGWSRWRRSDATARGRWHSVATWWILTLLFVALLVLGPPAVVVVMAFLSFFLLREALRLIDDERLLFGGAVLVGGVYLWAWLDWTSLFLGALPLLLAALGTVELLWMWAGESGFRLSRIRSRGRALLLALIGPSYTVAVALLPSPPGLPDSAMGWFALLFVLTELNDSAQAWGGRAFGIRRMAPRLSPGKTWAGFWSGVLVTAVASAIVAPMVTSYGRALPFTSGASGGVAPGAGTASGPSGGIGWPWLWGVGLGVLVALAGIAGDLLESSLKRRAGVKDSGDLLPGHGGLMDRFDSLAVTAPVFFAVTWFLWFWRP